ncbi:hypothetical protein FRC01_001747, partial [Tulasnella sp. 417]
MTTDPKEVWDNQDLKHYLRQEVEFTSSIVVSIAQTHSEWRAHRNINTSARRFLGIVSAAVTDWTRMVSQSPEGEIQEDVEDVIDDPKDSVYQENWIPTSFYQWAFLHLKHEFVDLADDEILDRLADRAENYDAKLFGWGCREPHLAVQGQVSQPFCPTLHDETNAGPTFIHRVPPEVLSEIFILAHGEVLYFPIIVSHVDSRFRTIAGYTTLLWTRIDVNLALPLVEIYLRCSKTAPLDIRIDLADGNRLQNASSRLGAFLALIVDHRERMASLTMSAFNPGLVDEMVKAMLRGPGSTYPRLRRLDTGCPIWESRIDPPTLEALKSPVLAPPTLSELSIRGYRSRNWVLGSPEPMVALKSLCLDNNPGLFPADLLATLARLPKLEKLVIQDCTTGVDILDAEPSAVTLPNLTALRYISLEDNSVTSIQRFLLTPKLSSLMVWWECGFKEWSDHAQPLMDMLEANPQLEHLDLCCCLIQPSGWRDAFSKAGSLRYLRLRSCELESDDIEALSETGFGEDGQQCLLPHLEHLALENVFELSTGDVRRIVMHRPGLQSLELRGWDGSNVVDDDVEFIRESVEWFVLETFYKGSGVLEEEQGEEESEDWSSDGTPSVGSWLSGDEEVVARHLAASSSGVVPIRIMTIYSEDLWDDQGIDDYLKQELEFAKALAAHVVQAYNDQGIQHFDIPTSIPGVVSAAVTTWKRKLSCVPTARWQAEGGGENIDGSDEFAYDEYGTPTSLYRWTYFSLKSAPVDLADDPLRDELVVRMFRTQYCDAKFFAGGCEDAYPPDENRVSQSSSSSPEIARGVKPASIHKLPPEILSYTLIIAHQGAPYFPIIVSHVDSRFRRIVQSTGLLWTTIDVNLPLPIVAMYLKHSNTAPLDVRIDLLDSGLRRSVSSWRLEAFVTAVAEHRERIRSLSILSFSLKTVDEMLMLSDVLAILPKLPNLETLVIEDCIIFGNTPSSTPAIILPNLTSLQLVGLNDKSIDLVRQALLAPRLESLKVWWDVIFRHGVKRERPLVAMLQASPRVERLDLCNCEIRHSKWGDVFNNARYLRYLRMRSCELRSADLEVLAGPDIAQE